MNLFDTHCHLTDSRFNGDIPDVIEKTLGKVEHKEVTSLGVVLDADESAREVASLIIEGGIQ